MTSSQRNFEAEGYRNHEYDTISESGLLFKVKWYDEEDRRKFSSSSKIVLREGPGSTVKIYHDNDIADQARNVVMDYHSNENSQEVVHWHNILEITGGNTQGRSK